MTRLRLRGPGQQRDTVRPTLKTPQLLARPVPVDQEHQPRSEELQVRPAGFIVRGLDLPRREIERRPRRRPRSPSLPSKAARPEHRLEEREALGMHIRVCDAHQPVLHVNDDDVSVGFADVVLDYETSSSPRGGRRKARVVELQLRSAVHPGHEGRH